VVQDMPDITGAGTNTISPDCIL